MADSPLLALLADALAFVRDQAVFLADSRDSVVVDRDGPSVEWERSKARRFMLANRVEWADLVAAGLAEVLSAPGQHLDHWADPLADAVQRADVLALEAVALAAEIRRHLAVGALGALMDDCDALRQSGIDD